jgi:mRNA interferase RelE/StbE
LTSYSLEFHPLALKEWHHLDRTVQLQFKTQLRKRLIQPHVPSARLHGELKNTYKIKLQRLGYRLVYEVIEKRLVVYVIAVGKRSHDAAYTKANDRV